MLPIKNIFKINEFGQKIVYNQADIELSEIENTSRKEFCQNPEDVKNADATTKIIHFTSKKAGDLVADIEIPKDEIITIYYKFIINSPITIIERDYLLEFLKDEKVFKIAQNIFSKMFLLQGNENNDFLQNFLKNSEGKFDITQFVNYLINKLTNYKIIIPNYEEIKFIDEDNTGKYYTFRSNGKIGIFIVTNNEVFNLNGVFENIKLLPNGLVFVVKENEIKNSNSKPIEKKVGVFYKFDGNDFERVYNRPGIVDIINLDEENYITTGEDGKKGLIKIIKNEKANIEINIILNPEYDRINIKDQFILVGNKLKDTNRYTLGVNIITGNGYKSLVEETCIEEDIITTNYRLLMPEFQIIDKDYIQIETKNGINIYKYDETNNTLEIVPGLEGIEYIFSVNKLLDGIPSCIKYENGKNGIYVFNRENGELKNLVDFLKLIKGTTYLHNPVFNGDRIKIEGIDSTTPLFWKNAKLYTIKKGYKIWDSSRDLYIVKGFFGKQVKVSNNFEEMQEYLEPAILPIIIK